MSNEGYAGLTTVDFYEKNQNKDFSGHDFAIIHLGVNDVSKKLPIKETSEAYLKIIEQLKATNNGIKIFVCTIIPAYADMIVEQQYSDINSFIRSLEKIQDVYVCDLTKYGHEYTESQYAAGHLTAYGYYRMAEDLKNYISFIMRKKPAEFRFIHFIGTDMEY